MKLIVGLGNPGKEYLKTRHNVGFLVLDAIQKRMKDAGWSEWELSKKFNAEIAEGSVQGEKIILIKPMTFMNDSGLAVQILVRFYKLSPPDVIVVHDDKDLPLGTGKLQRNRGSAGHQGVHSIIEHLGSQDFTRLRLGIAPTDKRKMKNASKFVLGKFGLFEKKILQQMVEKAADDVLQSI